MAEVSASAEVKATQDHRSRVRSGAPVSVVPGFNIDSLCRIAEQAEEGCFVEVGVYRGGTAYYLNEIAIEQGRKLYLYDTFDGIPYQDEVMGDRHRVGDFSDTSMAEVVAAVPEAIVVKGLFPASIIPMPPVAFAHIDCDQYQSIIDSVHALRPLMVDGGIMLFDDYGCLEGATRAVEELFPKDRIISTDVGKAMVIF